MYTTLYLSALGTFLD